MTKTDLLAALTTVRDETLAALRDVAREAFDQGRYENGWNGREILAHIASIEWTYPRLIDLAREAPDGARAPSPATAAPRRTTEAESVGTPTRAAEGGILSYNDRQVTKRAGVPVPDLIAEWERNRNALIAAVDACEDALLARHVRSTGGITGALADVIDAVANGHVRMHVADIAGKEWTGARF